MTGFVGSFNNKTRNILIIRCFKNLPLIKYECFAYLSCVIHSVVSDVLEVGCPNVDLWLQLMVDITHN